MTGETHKIRNWKSGVRAEALTAFWLICKGYRILERRYKTPVGEIDVIARKGRKISFIEVKYRQNMDEALQCVTLKGRQRITRAAQHFLMMYPEYADFEMRFDLFAIGRGWQWRHLDNAWMTEA